jgi:hypothetical protein
MIRVQNDHVIEQLSADAPDPALGRSVLPRASKRRPLRGHLESLDRHCDCGGEDRHAIGHVRYSTSGCSEFRNAQPFCATTDGGPVAIAHNGNLVNANAIRRELEGRGAIFSTGADSEVIVQLLARSRERNLEERLIDALSRWGGSTAPGSSPFASVSVPRSSEIRARSLPPPSRLRARHQPRRGAHASCPGQGFRRPL